MDQNKVAGTIKSVAGKVQDIAGQVTDDLPTSIQGKARELGGKAQQAYGEGADRLRDATVAQPLTSLMIAGSLGLILGVMLARR